MDAEPYGQAITTGRVRTTPTMYNQGRLLAPTIKSVGKFIIYPSSNASFPGSYNDLIRRPRAATPNFTPTAASPTSCRASSTAASTSPSRRLVPLRGPIRRRPRQLGHRHRPLGRRSPTRRIPNMHGSVDDLARQRRTQRWRQPPATSAPPKSKTCVTAGLPQVDGPFIIYEHQLGHGTITSQLERLPRRHRRRSPQPRLNPTPKHPNHDQGHRAHHTVAQSRHGSGYSVRKAPPSTRMHAPLT